MRVKVITLVITMVLACTHQVMAKDSPWDSGALYAARNAVDAAFAVAEDAGWDSQENGTPYAREAYYSFVQTHPRRWARGEMSEATLLARMDQALVLHSAAVQAAYANFAVRQSGVTLEALYAAVDARNAFVAYRDEVLRLLDVARGYPNLVVESLWDDNDLY
jgi:hypothetical protein